MLIVDSRPISRSLSYKRVINTYTGTINICDKDILQDIKDMGHEIINLNNKRQNKRKVGLCDCGKFHLLLDIDSGIIEECGEEALKYKSKQIINKELIKIKWIVKDDGDEFHNTIKKKYKEFNRKSKLLGLSNDFRYRIIGKEVIITEYLGTSGKLVVPSFITGINDRAFNRIKGIELHKDIKYIRKHIDLEHMDIECNMDYKSNNGIVKEWL